MLFLLFGEEHFQSHSSYSSSHIYLPCLSVLRRVTATVVASLQFAGSEAGEKRYLVLGSSMIQCLWGDRVPHCLSKVMPSSFSLREKEQ